MHDMTRIEPDPGVTTRFAMSEFKQLLQTGALDALGKFELVRGELVRISPASRWLMRYARQIFRELDRIFGDGLDGWIAQFEMSVQLGPETVRDADVGIVADLDGSTEFFDPPLVLLAVEVSLTTLQYDLAVKRRDHAGAAVPNYWVVDVQNRRVHVMTTPLDGDYAERRLVAFGEPLPVPGTDRTITIG